MVGAALLLLGLFALPRLAVALLPSFTPPSVAISIDYPNVAPEAMESAITRPIENAIGKVGGISTLMSTSYYGTTTFRVEFVYGTDINAAAVDLEQQIAAARSQLPNDPMLGQPRIVKANPNALPVVQLYISDTKLTQPDLGDLVSNDLANQFSSIAGVAAVDVGGALQRAIMVEPNQMALAASGVTADEIVNRLKQEHVDIPAGIVRIGRDELQIRTSALLRSAAEVGAVPLAFRGGTSIRLRDVAAVHDSALEARSYARLNGQPAISVQISAQPSANVVAVADDVYAKIAKMRHAAPDLQFGVVLDQRDYILESLGALEHAALYGAGLAVLVIFVFLHSWRSTLIVAVSLPISVLGTLFVAYVLHETLNTMTLAGLALAIALVVDDAIVVLENISAGSAAMSM
jgi:HAE1 family hydrophobic/amphiphilic exporter-1